ncbi:MAG: sigma-54-dependent Fis family transcriptional regulator [Phycisphaerae bacterium]|nr:sigma-54-dependent Fis family transcriptional regulator [Phycisphaerae bacterium]MBM93063.1 sigma-54-dependent Fis family transcriptional regulator [Phycisphaerae bacterium]HCT43936.1 sigma-54-dependent Fis family transcriptional regulator [Phycisphaerales bacterium]
MADRTRILVIDDDAIVADSLAEFFQSGGANAHAVYSPSGALNELKRADDAGLGYQVVLCDINLPEMGGLDLLREIVRQHTQAAVIMLTGYGTIETAVQALRLGAVDFLTKPIVDEELRISLERALRQYELKRENTTMKSRLEHSFGLANMVGSDHRMEKIYETVHAVASSRTTVLMTGESGVGKSMIAKAIHQESNRGAKPYVELACGSIPETLLESELFGHVKGAFTGAHADKAGKFLAADGGTLFLDEINSASPAMQLKLLRVLQERKFEPVGSNETIEVDVRVILASNQDLEKLVADGSFRQDLYYRINVVKIEMPPLRERVGDIAMLAEHFLLQQGDELGRQFSGFTPEALDALRRYDYPGNVRELSNIVERAAVLSKNQTIELVDLPSHVLSNEDSPLSISPSVSTQDEWVPMTLSDAMMRPERDIIVRALEANEWNRQQTAEVLGINRTTLYKKMKQLGIDPEDHAQAG